MMITTLTLLVGLASIFFARALVMATMASREFQGTATLERSPATGVLMIRLAHQGGPTYVVRSAHVSLRDGDGDCWEVPGVGCFGPRKSAVRKGDRRSWSVSGSLLLEFPFTEFEALREQPDHVRVHLRVGHPGLLFPTILIELRVALVPVN